MKRKFLSFLLVITFITCSAGMLWAMPMTNTSGDGFEDYPFDVGSFSAGDRFAWYQNTGTWMFVGNYNNESNISLVQIDVINWLNSNLPSYDTSSFTLVDTTNAVTVTGVDYDGITSNDVTTSASGTYQVNTSLYPGGIEFYAVKAGNDFAMYFENGGETFGSWSTFDLWLDEGNGSSLEISHFTGYNGSGTPIPEPATMLLLGTGLMGIGSIGRKKLKKQQ